MSTFFLEDAIASTNVETDLVLTESEIEAESLLIENSVLEAELEYQSFMQEAILSEAANLLYEADEEDKKGAWTAIKEFFAKIGAWFKKMAGIVKGWADSVVANVKNNIDGLKEKIKAKNADKAIYIQSKKYNFTDKAFSEVERTIKAAASQPLEKESEVLKKLNDDVAEIVKLPKENKTPSRLETTAKKGYEKVAKASDLIKQVQNIALGLVKASKDSQKTSESAEKSVEKATEEKIGIFQKIKTKLINFREGISAKFKAIGTTTRYLSAISNAFGRAILGATFSSKEATLKARDKRAAKRTVAAKAEARKAAADATK